MSVELTVQASPTSTSQIDVLGEKRREPRRTIYGSHWLTISSVRGGFSSFVVAKLVDVSTGGFGVLTMEPVEAGREYAVAGLVQVDEHWLEISGHARVAYCKPADEGTFRVGLGASGIRCERISNPNQASRAILERRLDG